MEYSKQEIDLLIERNINHVYRLAMIYCKNTADAEDILQEVFMIFCKVRPLFHNLEHEKAWFIRVTINCCKDLFKTAWFRKTAPFTDTLEQSIYKKDETLELVMRLPQRYKLVIYLHYYAGYSIEEIGGLLSKNTSTLRTWLQRARMMLKESIERSERYGS